MIKAILFDCFGVVRTDGFAAAYRTMGGDPEKDEEFIRNVLYQSNSGKIPTSAPIIAARLGIGEEEWVQANTSHGSIDMELLAYVQELRKDYKVGMLSNVGKGRLSRFFEPGFLEQYFDEVVSSGDIGYAKPEAQAYEITADKLGVRLDECIFIDDREEYVEGAQSVGMKTILHTDFKDFKTQLSKLL